MTSPNMFIVYVSDVARTVDFYRQLFDIAPEFFPSPGFATFALGEGVDLALWSGHDDALAGDPTRTSEVCVCLSGGPEVLEAQLRTWTDLGVTVLEPPHEAVFGLTAVVADPDGNRIRLAPVD
ncbi:VOC family protein [Brachybacterium sacelli]|uniref:Enzyme related to lactoylglutathione lyase n=1 Tax=Brachybacterium sacelli TaxID=173364 RepID=A0ABS4WZU0_9MICO|nr:VOC family protein [Brachybacterium sacelli]MBP2381611.1 putative enzyme related to lactoylglutathione lyase [Brachybacterium sacelli]